MNATIKNLFIDQDKIRRLALNWSERALSGPGGLGAFIYISARSLLRRRKRPSTPGDAPSVHTTHPLVTLRNIQTAYDRSTMTMVVGPLFVSSAASMRIGGAVPGILEHGGKSAIREMLMPDGTWKQIGWRRRAKELWVPVWKATQAQKARSVKIKSIRTITGKRNGHVANFYVIPTADTIRVRQVAIAARPYMAPAAAKGIADWRRKFGLEKAGA